MFGSIGMPEIIIILVIALVIFGPGKLPEIGGAIGRGIKDFKRAMTAPEKKTEENAEARRIKDAQNS
ncbi:MAG: Sec-independent protein translocase protein TatAd [Syntrophus sp. SKADARSKE-3]|nr:Sec-independent protein translocase protein TatAd [Syntrophus sp. SKADARSKE-3]